MHGLLHVMDFGVEICACGHPVYKHDLADTEYARCRGSSTLCRCEGWVRKVGIGYGSISKFFRRNFRVEADGEYSTLNRAVFKCLDSGLDFVWTIGKCESCGGASSENAMYGYAKMESGKLTVEVVCGICKLERGE